MFSSFQGHTICGASTTVCSHGPRQKAGSSSASNLPTRQRRAWLACTVCCYGNSLTCGVRLCCTTRCTTLQAWASASSSVTSHASCRTRMFAGNTVWEPKGDRRTPHSPVNEYTQTHKEVGLVKKNPSFDTQLIYFMTPVNLSFVWHCHRDTTLGVDSLH